MSPETNVRMDGGDERIISVESQATDGHCYSYTSISTKKLHRVPSSLYLVDRRVQGLPAPYMKTRVLLRIALGLAKLATSNRDVYFSAHLWRRRSGYA